MTAVFTFITLYGLSLSLWGSIGLARFFSERYRERGQSVLLPALIFTAGGLLSSALALPFLSASWPATEAGPVNQAALYGLWATTILAAGILGSYLSAWLSGATLSAVPVLLFGATYWAGLWYLGLGGSPGGAAMTAGQVFSLPALGLTLASGWMGLRAGPGRAGPRQANPQPLRIRPEEVAVIIAAHNEGSAIGDCLAAVTKAIPPERIYVGSDGSTDDTVAAARRWGCNVWDIQPNRGKAHALKGLIERYRLTERYKALVILDADSEMDPNYLSRALPLFNDEGVAAIAGHVIPVWKRHRRPRWAMFFVAYRVRLYKITQAFLRYGQTWRHSNVSFIVPGFASMYRCSALSQIDITAPGLIIEDFNMTFELHHKHLGRVAYTPRVRCASQDPTSLKDYFRQVKRWDLGLWQTIRRHGMWPGLFWASLGTFIAEMFIQSVTFLTVPFLLLWFIWYPDDKVALLLPLGVVQVGLLDVLIGVMLADYLLTAIVAVLERKPVMFIYGLGFIIPRWIDSLLFLTTLPMAWFVHSDGRWTSPKRA